MNDLLQQKIVEILTQFQQAASTTLNAAGKAAPHVVEYAIRVKFYEGLGQILGGLVMLFFAILFLSIIFRHRAAIIESFEDLEPAHVVISTFIFGVMALILFCFSMSILTDTWNWVAVFDPKTALAHDLFEKVMAGFGR